MIKTMSKVTWHSVLEEALPENQNILAFNEEWVDGDWNPQGVRLGYYSPEDEEFVCSDWDDSEEEYTTYHINKKNKRIFPEYWAQIPHTDIY